MKRFLQSLLVFAIALMIVVLLFPSTKVNAVHTFNGGVIVIDEMTVADYGTEFIITGDVYSVTVAGNVDVTLIFDNVDIDRQTDGVGRSTAEELYAAGKRLGWVYAGTSYYVPTCPFLITEGASVKARFDGNCTFRAGANGCYVDENYNFRTDAHIYRGGYAGIQVAGDSSLTIAGANNLKAYGAYQIAGVFTKDPSTSASDDPLVVNRQWSGSWDDYPVGAVNGHAAGGAGIGGGVSYHTTDIAVGGNGYTEGTPGEIIIDSGNIYAVGGHLAAGIGGGVNSAATTSHILINGGEITTIGGRYACGIGDGDSTNDFETALYYEEYRISITGGKINAYGGTASAAIGTTDNITSESDARDSSGLTITISGGHLYAVSGEATGDNSATAAIGSGQNTDMNDNSITVYSTAKVVAASFSRYAISNCGTDASKIPGVNIDPSGYMYLARFKASDEDRIFTRFPVKRDAAGNSMLVTARAAEILSSGGNIPSDALFYALDRNSSQYPYLYYCVDKNGKLADEYGNSLPEGSMRVYPAEIPDISYYYDVSSPIGTLIIPGNYTAFAISMENPEVYGGCYVIHVPDGGDGLSDDVYVVIQKHESGTTSGEIINEGSEYHISKGSNDASRETPNIQEDERAEPFMDIGIFIVDPDTGVAETWNCIENFNPNTYAYTVYLPYGTEKFNVCSAYNITDNVREVTMDFGSVEAQRVLTYEQTHGVMQNTSAISLNGGSQIEIWLRKTNTSSGVATNLYIVYKILVIVKPRYTIEISPLDKEYDGMHVIPVAEKLVRPSGYQFHVSDGADSSPSDPNYTVMLSGGVPGAVIGEYTKSFQYGAESAQSSKYTIRMILNQKDNMYQLITTLQSADVAADTAMIVSSIHLDRLDSSEKRITFDFSRTSIGYFAIGVENDTLWLYGKNNSYQLLSIVLSEPEITSSLTDAEIAANKERAIEQVKASINANFDSNNEQTQYSVNVKYDKGIITEDYTLSVVDYQNSGESFYHLYKTYEKPLVGNVRIYTTYLSEVDLIVQMSALEKNSIEYTYYRILSVDENNNPIEYESLGSAAPKNAGHYYVAATLRADEYEAYGSRRFTIFRREISIIAIENWLAYLTPAEIENYDGVIENPGQIVFSHVLPGETVTLLPGYSAFYRDRGVTGTYADDIGYYERKIELRDVWLDPENPVNSNYLFLSSATQDDGSAVFRVYGQLSYRTTGAIFRKTLAANSYWRKFYPTTDQTFLKWKTDENGKYVLDEDGCLIFEEGETRIDYHSPSNAEHRDYVYLRTVNDGKNKARYAVDIEFGAMEFIYSRAVWDVNSYEYVEGDTGYWTGNGGENNRISVYNYSNKAIEFCIDAEIDFFYRPIADGSENGIRVSLSDNDGITFALNTPMTVSAAVATNGDIPGYASLEQMNLILSGVPQMNSENFITVGLVTVTVSKASS